MLEIECRLMNTNEINQTDITQNSYQICVSPTMNFNSTQYALGSVRIIQYLQLKFDIS